MLFLLIIRKHIVSRTYKNLFISTSVVFSYLFVEWIYNQHLLILLSYDHISPEDFQFTEIFGKAIASFGINLIVNSLFKKFKLSRFIIGLIIGYTGLTFLFDCAVNAFPNEFRHSSYYSMVYRKEVINQNDNLEILKFSNNNTWYEKSLVISQFVYVLKDKQWKDFEKKIKEPIGQKIDKLNKNRSQYFKDYQKFNKSYDKIIQAWGKYSAANANYNAYKSFMKGDLKKKFIQKVGLPPDLTFDEFIKKTAPEYEKISNTKIFDGNIESGVAPIYVKNIPKKMNESAFNQYLDNEIKKISTQIAPEISNIRENKKSFDTLAILVIPPISICLSLFSIILNILILFAKWTYTLSNCKRINESIYSCVVVVGFSLLIFLFANTQHTLTERDSYWSEIREINHNEHPMLFSIFSIGLKLEPFICFTNEEPQLIKSFTDYFYHK